MKHFFLSLATLCLWAGSVSAQTQNEEELTGSYVSKRGVMDKASCHGFNIGYIQTADARKIVCFDRMDGGEDINVNCDILWVQGYTEQHTANPNGACPGDVKYVFFVTDWGCK